jgi:hypothetical protein
MTAAAENQNRSYVTKNVQAKSVKTQPLKRYEALIACNCYETDILDRSSVKTPSSQNFDFSALKMH